MPVRRNAVIGALLIGMLAALFWFVPSVSAEPLAAGRRAPAVAEQGIASAAVGTMPVPGAHRQLPPSNVFRETTTWYSLSCVWSVCDTLFSLTALQHFSIHGYLAMLQFNIWNPQVRAAISIYGPTIDTLADQAMLSWPLLSIETVTSSVQWLGYSIGLYTVGF
jgi:hypothetical protein